MERSFDAEIGDLVVKTYPGSLGKLDSLAVPPLDHFLSLDLMGNPFAFKPTCEKFDLSPFEMRSVELDCSRDHLSCSPLFRLFSEQ